MKEDMATCCPKGTGASEENENREGRKLYVNFSKGTSIGSNYTKMKNWSEAE